MELYSAAASQQWAIVQSLLNKNPNKSQAEYQDKTTKSTALHEACYYNAPPQTIQLLLSACRDHAIQLDTNGETPLFLALCCASPKTVMLILHECPESASIRHPDYGYSSLHLAIQRHRSVREIRCLIECDPFMVTAIDENGDSPLKLFFNDWNATLRNMETFLNDAPPSSILSHRIPPRSLEVRELYELTCYLLQAAFHRTLPDPNRLDACILHIALQTPSCPWSFFHLLHRIHPDKALEYDSDGNLPIHVAVKSHLTSDSYSYRCSKCGLRFQNTIWYISTMSQLDLQINCQSCFAKATYDREEDYKVVHPVSLSMVFDALSHTAGVVNREGRYAVHMAVENGIGFHDGIQKLCQNAYHTVSEKDCKTGLYLFMLASTKGDIDTAYEALRMDPSLIRTG